MAHAADDCETTGHVPPHRRIAGRFARSILRGDYRPGDRLPSVRALAVEEGVNPNTIQRVYDVLEVDGWVERRQGAGTFVREPTPLARPRRRRLVGGLLVDARRRARRVGASEDDWSEADASARREVPLMEEKR